MADYLIRSGDSVQVTIAPPALVPALAAPVPLIGTGTTVLVAGAPACLQGDELPPSLRSPLPYTAPPFTNPGMGTLTLTLLPANTTQQTENGKPMLLKGQQFTATFTVSTPATQTTPAGPVPDPLLSKTGTAQFVTGNATVQAG